MRRTEAFDLGEDSQVQIKELTVGEIRNWMEQLATGESSFDAIDSLMLKDISFQDLKVITDITDDQLNEATPKLLTDLANRCREVNEDFFRLRTEVVKIGEQLLSVNDQEN